MNVRVVRLSEIARDRFLRLTAERYVDADEERRAKLLAHVQARLAPLEAERDAIRRAGPEELLDRFAARFWRRR